MHRWSTAGWPAAASSAGIAECSPPADGLPLPAVNVPLLGYEVDFLWPEARFVVEADGGDHLNPEQRDKDNARDIALGRAGYPVRRYSSGAMGNGEAVAGEVLAILAERLPANQP